MRYQKVITGLALSLTVLILVSMVSASVGDWFKGITGRATTADTNVTVTLSGTNQVVVQVFNQTLAGASVTPNEDTTLNIGFNVTLTDADGWQDINNLSVSANFSKNGEALRQNASCLQFGAGFGNSRNFTCTITVWYYDAPGAWSIMAGGTDYGTGVYVYNTTTTFTMGTRTSMVMSPSSISFGSVSPGAINQTATSHSLVNNTGNANITNVTVTAVNLYGLSLGTLINVGNFTVGNNSGSASCDTSTPNSASRMINASQIQIGNAQLLRGNHSINNNATGQEQLFYCFNTVPQIQSDSYSPPSLWTVTIV